MEKKRKHSFRIAMLLIFTMIFSTVTSMTLMMSKAYAQDGTQAENVSIKLQRYNYGDGVGITPKWVELHAEHQFAGAYEKISSPHEYGLRAEVSGSDAPVEWVVEEGSDFIKRVEKEKPKQNEFFFNIIGSGHVKIVAKCQGATNYVEFNTEYQEQKSNKVFCVWKLNSEPTYKDKTPVIDEKNQDPIVLDVGQKAYIEIRGERTKAYLNGVEIQYGITWKYSYKDGGETESKNSSEVASIAAKIDQFNNALGHKHIITAKAPGKTVITLSATVKGVKYELNIPVQVRG